MSNFKGPSWTSSHVYGQGSKNEKYKLSYFPVPKCASMWMRKYVHNNIGQSTQSPWEAADFTRDDLTGYRSIVILRDPVERWISACPASGKITELEKDPRSLDAIFDDLSDWQKDEHTAPQYDFINGLDFDNVVWFRCGSNLSADMTIFVDKNIGEHIPVPYPINEQPQDPLTKQSVESWRRLLSIPRYLEKFKLAYKKDYELIESVKFYAYT